MELMHGFPIYIQIFFRFKISFPHVETLRARNKSISSGIESQ